MLKRFWSDQGVFSDYFLEHPEYGIQLDYHSELFQSLFETSHMGYKCYPQADLAYSHGELYNTHTKTYPAVRVGGRFCGRCR